MGFTSGDLIEVTHLSYQKGKPYYEYKLLKKSQKQPTVVREEICGLPVKKHEELNRLFVEITTKGMDFPQPVLLSDHDVATYHLNEGDVINYVHEVDNIMQGCVSWKHKIELIPQRSEPKAPMKKAKPRKRRYLPIFQGLHILMIGGTNKSLHKNVKEEVENRAGLFHALTGDEKKSTIVSRIQWADIVVIYTESISHEAMYLAKETCKKHDVIHTFTKNCGGIQFVRRVSLLKGKLTENQS